MSPATSGWTSTHLVNTERAKPSPCTWTFTPSSGIASRVVAPSSVVVTSVTSGASHGTPVYAYLES